MKRYTTVYEECLKLFIKLQNSNYEEKLKIYDEMLEVIKSNFTKVNSIYNKRKIKKMLDTYYEIELSDPNDYGTISWYYLLCNIADIYCVSNKVVFAGTNGRYSYKNDYIQDIIELYATIMFLKKKLEAGCPDNVSLTKFNKIKMNEE